MIDQVDLSKTQSPRNAAGNGVPHTKKKCRYCASTMEFSASLCPTCKSSQSSWKNVLLFLAGLTGFVTLIAAAAVFLLNQGVNAYRTLAWAPKVNVLEFQTGVFPDFGIVLSNTGSGKVFVSDIQIFYGHGNINYHIKQIIDPGEILATDIDKVEKYSLLNLGPFVSSPTGLPVDAIVKNSGILSAPEVLDPELSCFLLVIFDGFSSVIDRMNLYYKTVGTQLVTKSVRAMVTYYGFRDNKKITDELNFIATFVFLKKEPCKRTYKTREGSSISTDIVLR